MLLQPLQAPVAAGSAQYATGKVEEVPIISMVQQALTDELERLRLQC